MKTSEIDRLLERAPRIPKNREPGTPVSISGKVDMVHLCSCWSCQISNIPYESRFAYEVAIEPRKDEPYHRYQKGKMVGVYVHIAVSRSEFEASAPSDGKEAAKELENDTDDDDKPIGSSVRVSFSKDQVLPDLLEKYGESLFRDMPVQEEPDPQLPAAHFDGDEIRQLVVEHNRRNPDLVDRPSQPTTNFNGTKLAEPKQMPKVNGYVKVAIVERLPPPPVRKPVRSKSMSDEEVKIGCTITGPGNITFHDLADGKSVEVALPIEGSLVMKPVGTEIKVIFDLNGFKGRKLMLSIIEWQHLKYTQGNGIEIKTKVID